MMVTSWRDGSTSQLTIGRSSNTTTTNIFIQQQSTTTFTTQNNIKENILRWGLFLTELCEGMFCEGDVLNMRRFVKVDVWHKGKLRIEEDVVLRGTFCV